MSEAEDHGIPAALKLKDMLTMDEKGGWISIMDFILEYVPYLMSSHRPTNEAIANSLVGKMGYRSFKIFREHELKWSDDKWRDMRKAYALVLAHPYLRELSLSRDAIIEAYKVCGHDFPECSEAWENYIRNKKAAHDRTSTEEACSIGALQKKIAGYREENAIVKADLRELQKNCVAYRQQLSDAINQVSHKEKELVELKGTVCKQVNSIRLLKCELSDAEIEQDNLYDVISEQERDQKYMFFMALFMVTALVFWLHHSS
jgi:predicted RNase H-like nuclease (RuvC/YqgF family)